MKTLNLTLKKKWFDLIKSGEKKEEYREIKSYWITRLVSDFSWDLNKYTLRLNEDKNVHNKGSLNPNVYDYITFRNGYSKDAPFFTIECLGIEMREGNQDWGAEKGIKYFVLKLGEIIEQ